MSQYEGTEPVRGLPERLPAGETLLWQGSPDWRTLARQAFGVRVIAVYFAVLLVWYLASLMADDASLPAPRDALPPLLGSAVAVMLLVMGFAWAVARTTVYTITSKRIVMRFGIALPISWNIPFARLSSADIKRFANGAGEVVLTPMADDHFAYLIMWPHVRAWDLRHTKPSLRCVADVMAVGRILSDALAADGHGAAQSADGHGTAQAGAGVQADGRNARDLGRHAPQAA